MAVKAPASALRISLHNSTLVLPQQDYAVLLAAAQQGWQPGMPTTSPLLALVTNFTMDTTLGLPIPNQPLHLTILALGSLGIRATRLTCVPEQPLPPGYKAPVVLKATSSSGGYSTGEKLAIGVACGVGGFILLAAVAVALLWSTRSRKR